MKKHLLTAAFAALLLTPTFQASAVDLKHKGFECSTCHAKGFTAPDRSTCLTCHTSDDIVKATEHFNFTTSFTNPVTGETKTSIAPVNPHDNFHFGRDDQCVNCHKEHKPSTTTCQTCHDIEPWGLKAPR